MTREPLTARGAEQLRRELEDLKSVQRPRVIAAIAEARAHGDLKENAEYHAAKDQQGFIEGRISEIEDRLGRAEALARRVVYFTTLAGAHAACMGMQHGDSLKVYSLQSLHQRLH
jgi:hypothetical protein